MKTIEELNRKIGEEGGKHEEEDICLKCQKNDEEEKNDLVQYKVDLALK
jgi:hypothetical protein